MERDLIYLALVHYPVMNRHGELIASAITNLDIHDIARLARTYDLSAYYLVTPLVDQQVLARRLIMHWRDGVGGNLNPDRQVAMELLRIADSIEDVCKEITLETGSRPLIYATTARHWPGSLAWSELRRKIGRYHNGILLLFGTASGLHESVLRNADGVLSPIEGRRKYNHLSVRSAVAIALDRLLGEERL